MREDEERKFKQLVLTLIHELTGYSTHGVRYFNQVALFLLLLKRSTLTRASIASLLKISHPSMVNLIKDLLEREFLREVKKERRAALGRPSSNLRLKEETHVVYCLDLCRENFALTVVDLTLNPLSRLEHDYDHQRDFESNLSLFLERAKTFSESYSQAVVVLSLVVPGVYVEKDDSLHFCRVKELGEISLLSFVKPYFSEIKIRIESDIDCAFWGELLLEGELMDNVCYVSWDEGLKICHFVEGKLIKGAEGFAGEIADWKSGGRRIEELGCGLKEGEESPEESRLRKREALEELSKVLALFVCGFNPQYIILNGDLFDSEPEVCETLLSLLKERVPYREFYEELIIKKGLPFRKNLLSGLVIRGFLAALLQKDADEESE